MICFIHIPKTAGTTFYDIVQKNHHSFLKPKAEDFPDGYLKNNIVSKCAVRLPGGYLTAPKVTELILSLDEEYIENINFIGGHIGFGIHEKVKNNVNYISFLREPRERLFSDFREHHKPGRFFYEKLKLENFDFNRYLELLLEHQLDNIITRQVAGPYDFFNQNIQLDSNYLDKAKQNSKKISFFDINEFNDSLYKLKKDFGWRNFKYTRKNTSIAQSNIEFDNALLGEVLKYDYQLFNFIDCYDAANESRLKVNFFKFINNLK
jgi:hypothetical protein